MFRRSVFHFSIIALLAAFASSCIDTKKTTYFNDLNETVVASSYTDTIQHIIESNDILGIKVSSLSEEASKPFNNTYVTGGTTSVTGTRNEGAGYLVNPQGYIQMPILGQVKAAGYTRDQLRDHITKLILQTQLLKEPIVEVRHLNYEVTILGEVGRPTVITVPNEKISLIKALGAAGDITIFGRRDNVMLLREINGKKIVKRINLNSSSFLNSEYYYLQPNDVVYVEATKNKEASVSRNRIILPSVLSGLSVMVILIDRITRN